MAVDLFFKTKSPRKNVPDVGIELGATCMPSGHASDRATASTLYMIFLSCLRRNIRQFMRKHVLEVSDRVRLKQACSATEARWCHEIKHTKTRNIILRI